MASNRITRRQAFFALCAGAAPRARAATGILRATRVDHVALVVGDIDKGMHFYRRLFGNDVLKNVRTERRYLHVGPSYLGIEAVAAGQVKRIDHVGIGIENFNPETVKASLEKAGLQVREGAGLYVTDPDGTSLQLWADQSWTLNNAAPEPGPKQEPLFRARGIHHVSIQTSDIARSLDFYEKLFGKPVQGAGAPSNPTFILGESRIVLYAPAPGKPPKIDHFSVLADQFDAPAAVKVLNGLNAQAALSGQGALNEFFDPDGIRLQVTVQP